MQRIATTKFALAIFGIALLLFSPAGICAGAAGSKSPAHPCCPKPAAPHQQNSTNPGCVCIDGNLAGPSLGPLIQEQQDVAQAEVIPVITAEMPVRDFGRTEPASPTPDERFLRYRQLLL